MTPLLFLMRKKAVEVIPNSDLHRATFSTVSIRSFKPLSSLGFTDETQCAVVLFSFPEAETKVRVLNSSFEDLSGETIGIHIKVCAVPEFLAIVLWAWPSTQGP